jgi:hypothetical protein
MIDEMRIDQPCRAPCLGFRAWERVGQIMLGLDANFFFRKLAA